ncbi:MAG: hypothetical protein FJW26_17755 [Acidimicrobiia bacterium]|nr:hypothetical protein [Acidimicrobiia bacterium]
MRRRVVGCLSLACIASLSLFALPASEAFGQQTPVKPEVHRVTASAYYGTFSRAHPVLKRVRSGDTVVTKTLDASGMDETGVRKSQYGNPLTGAFYVEEAEPGDTLVVHFLKVRISRNWGWSTYRLGLFSLSPESVEGIYPSRYKDNLIRPGSSNLVPWDIDLARQMVRLREPVSGAVKLEFPAKPMLGCVGVAPAGDFAPTSGPSGSYGGNLDYNEIGEGAVVLLPVYQRRGARQQPPPHCPTLARQTQTATPCRRLISRLETFVPSYCADVSAGNAVCLLVSLCSRFFHTPTVIIATCRGSPQPPSATFNRFATETN